MSERGLLVLYDSNYGQTRKGLPDDTSRNAELTDWDAVDRFAAELVDAFGLIPAP